MTKPIIRMEVQAAPLIDMLGDEYYFWQVYQQVGQDRIMLRSGYEYDFYDAVECA